MQTFDRITTYPYGTNAFKLCESEMLNKYKRLILIIILMKNKTECSSKWPYIQDDPYRISIVRKKTWSIVLDLGKQMHY